MEVDPGADLLARLPVELFLLILQEALKCPRVWNYYRRLVTFSSVCRFWRNFLISTPSFWRFFGIIRSDRMMRLAYERCKSSPLEVVLELGDGTDGRRQWQHAVLSACHRWKKADLSYGDLSQQDDDNVLTRTAAPLLEELRLRVSWLDWEIPALPLKNLFSNAIPRLRRLDMPGVLLLPTSGLPSLQSLRIVDESVTVISVSQFIQLLAVCPNLAELELTGIEADGNEISLPSEEIHFKLPYLKTLILWNCAHTIASALLLPEAIPSCHRIFTTISDYVDATDRMLKVVEGFAPLIQTCFKQDPEVFIALGNTRLAIGMDWLEWDQRPTSPFFYMDFEVSDSANPIPIPRCLRLLDKFDLLRDSPTLSISFAVECPLSDDIKRGPCRWPCITEFACRDDPTVWAMLSDPLKEYTPKGLLRFPLLRHLEISGRDVLRSYWLQASNALQLRIRGAEEERCVPLQVLALPLTDMDDEMVAKLKQLMGPNSKTALQSAKWEKDPHWFEPGLEPVKIHNR